eukprot:3422311-Prymnesium_polylepis.1
MRAGGRAASPAPASEQWPTTLSAAEVTAVRAHGTGVLLFCVSLFPDGDAHVSLFTLGPALLRLGCSVRTSVVAC